MLAVENSMKQQIMQTYFRHNPPGPSGFRRPCGPGWTEHHFALTKHCFSFQGSGYLKLDGWAQLTAVRRCEAPDDSSIKTRSDKKETCILLLSMCDSRELLCNEGWYGGASAFRRDR